MKKLKHARSGNQTIYVVFIPLLFIFVVMVLLGMLFVRGYDIGNAIPYGVSHSVVDEVPINDPHLEPIIIADTTELPDHLPHLPAPQKTPSVAQHAQLRPQPASHSSRPLPPVAHAATSATTPVAETVHQAIDQLPSPPGAEQVPQVVTQGILPLPHND